MLIMYELRYLGINIVSQERLRHSFIMAAVDLFLVEDE